MKKFLLCIIAVATLPFAAFSAPIVIQEQGSFTAGGSTLKNNGEFVFSDLWSQSGQTAYGDNAFV
ncbi:MAG: alpha/beta hydrolase, partial [Synergistaceae bacterium]|nr:alpha/beta hydrolase [Synergistaceae bacterium]